MKNIVTRVGISHTSCESWLIFPNIFAVRIHKSTPSFEIPLVLFTVKSYRIRFLGKFMHGLHLALYDGACWLDQINLLRASALLVRLRPNNSSGRKMQAGNGGTSTAARRRSVLENCGNCARRWLLSFLGTG
jgi:hypothetical protein